MNLPAPPQVIATVSRMKRGAVKPKGPRGTTATVRQNCTLHWAYLEFAIRSAAAKTSAKNKPSIPVSRNIIEAVRYSYDFLDAAAEFIHELYTGAQLKNCGHRNSLASYMNRAWNGLSLSDKLGLLSFSCSGQGFWQTQDEFNLFEELRTLRNALTHPGIFGMQTENRFTKDSTVANSSRKIIYGKMHRTKSAVAGFAQHPDDLGRDDGRKAVEIALRHAERMEKLFSPGFTYFSRINPRTGKVQHATKMLARMKRHFDGVWH